jgi:hypothetical protein
MISGNLFNSAGAHELACLVFSLVFSGLALTACAPGPEGATGAAAPALAEDLVVGPEASGTSVDIPGARADRSCVHQVPDGATVASDGTVRLNGKVVAKFSACSASVVPHKAPGRTTDKGRIEDDSAVAFPRGACPAPHGNCAGFYDGLQDAWTVPAAPASNGALIYLFNALASTDGATTASSVLQYGSNGLFGGNSWTVSSWYVTKHNVFHTAPVPVSPGDTVSGGLFGADCGTSGKCTWMLASSGPAFPDMTVAGATPLVTAYRAVLEAFHLSACDRLPASGSTVFDFTIVTEPDSAGQGQDEIEDVLTWIPSVTPGLTPSCGYDVTDDEFSATLKY